MKQHSVITCIGNKSEQKQSRSDEGPFADLPLAGEELVMTRTLLGNFRSHVAARKKAGTVEAAIGCVLPVVRFTQLPPWRWTHQDVTNFIAHKVENDGIGVSRQAQYFTYLRAFQNFILRDKPRRNQIKTQFGVVFQEFIDEENSIAIKGKGSRPKQARRSLSREEYEAILDEFDKCILVAYRANSKSRFVLMRDKTMVQVAYIFGLRIDELTGIHLSDFQEDVNYENFGPYALLSIIGKGGKFRIVRAMNPDIREVLDWYVENVRPYFVKEQTEDLDLLFYSERGNRLLNDQLGRRLKDITTQAGIVGKRITPHVLRHTFNTHLMPLVGPEGVQRQMGHESLWHTLGTYYHEDPDQIGQNIDNAIGSVTAAFSGGLGDDQRGHDTGLGVDRASHNCLAPSSNTKTRKP